MAECGYLRRNLPLLFGFDRLGCIQETVLRRDKEES